MCAINHLVANKNSACLPWICQWRLHFPSVRLDGVANQACISLGPRFGAGEAPSPTHTPGLCGLQPPCAPLPAHTRTRASRCAALPPELARVQGLGTRRWRRRLPVPGRAAGLPGQTLPGSATSPSCSSGGGASRLLRGATRLGRPTRVPIFAPSRPAPRCPGARSRWASSGREPSLGRGTDPKPRGGRSPGFFQDPRHS